jgi:hypothetical protein
MRVLRRDAAGLSGKALGNEFNLRISWQPEKNLDLLIGWGCFSPSEYVEKTGTADAASGYFLQASYVF